MSENEARYHSMATALGRYRDSQKSLAAISSSEDGDKMLVPMTGSLFIPGKLTDRNHVTIEIGTGFFVKRTIPDAKAFLNRKINNLEKFTERLGESILAQGTNLRQIENVMRMKVDQVKQQQDA